MPLPHRIGCVESGTTTQPAVGLNNREEDMADQVRVSHILLMYEGSERSTATRSKEEALAEIGTIRDQLGNGGDFAALAKAHSDCPSGQEGGDLGTFPRGAMVPEFDAAAFALAPGTDSDVVETAFGYHLIRRTE